MTYKIAKLSKNHKRLYVEYEQILKQMEIKENNVVDVYFLYNNINHDFCEEEEMHMYNQDGFELSVFNDHHEYSYIVIFISYQIGTGAGGENVDESCVMARYRTLEVECDLPKICVYGDDDGNSDLTYHDLLGISDNTVRSLLISTFEKIFDHLRIIPKI